MTKLVKYEAARRALAAATSVDEVKQIYDTSRAFAAYAKQAKDGELLGKAVELKERAVSRLAELHDQRRKAGTLATGGDRAGRKRKIGGVRKTPAIKPPTLEEQGVDKNLAKQVRHAAKATPEQREAEIEKKKRLAVATVEGDKAVINEAKAEKQQEKKQRREQREQALAAKITALPQKRYGVILADPEWRFEPWSRSTGMDRSADNHYPTSVLEVIVARPVETIAADDAVLLLWATVPMMPQGVLVMGAWGFDYVSHIVWNKPRIGTGFWVRNKHELLLIGSRGKFPAPVMGTQFNSVIDAPVMAHSEKPDFAHLFAETFYPTLPKIELNARQARPGWDAWGYEAPGERAEAA
jgi:N6-adenosine-specific RNA methylase IME4